MEKQLLCDECDLAFAKTSALKEHKQVQHEGEVTILFLTQGFKRIRQWPIN